MIHIRSEQIVTGRIWFFYVKNENVPDHVRGSNSGY